MREGRTYRRCQEESCGLPVADPDDEFCPECYEDNRLEITGPKPPKRGRDRW